MNIIKSRSFKFLIIFLCATLTVFVFQNCGSPTLNKQNSESASSASNTIVEVGASHSCSIVGGALRCWGWNSTGPVGGNVGENYGTLIRQLTPYTVFASGATAVAAGRGHTCAIILGALWCWGSNDVGQLGDGTSTNRFSPVMIFNSGASSVFAGGNHTCAIVSGAFWCWGSNDVGQLGDGTTTNRFSPVLVQGLGSGVTAAALGDSANTCAVVSGALWCWGSNSYGQLFTGTSDSATHMTPIKVFNSGVSFVSAGRATTCAIVSGVAQCAGIVSGVFGSLVNVTAISADSDQQVCAITAGALQCWGFNSNGEVGDGTTTNRVTPFTTIKSGVSSISTGFGHTCAVADGVVQCWGDNSYGQIGDGTAIDRLTPVPVSL